jgi:hypothetical protein
MVYNVFGLPLGGLLPYGKGAIVMIKITLSDIIGLISLIVNIIALFKRDK